MNERENEKCSRIIFSYRVTGQSTQSDIVSICPNGTGKFRLTSDDHGDFMPAWSPDGSKIAFLSNRAGQPGAFRNGTEQLYVMDDDGNNIYQITFDLLQIEDIFWLPDGKRIVLKTISDPQNWVVKWIMADVTTKEITTIDWLPDANNVELSHDGTRILYTADSQIRVRNRDGTGDKALTDNSWINSSPVWSLDDRKIAFISYQEGQPYTFNVIEEDGTHLMKLVFIIDPPLEGGLAEFDFDWAPDGRSFIIRAGGSLWSMNLVTGEQSTLFSFGEWPNEITHLDWQPE